jgi:hypothetical protein
VRQYRDHLAAQLPATIAHDRSPDRGDTQNAAVRSPPAPPAERQIIVGPVTRTCPSRLMPIRLPISAASASRDACGSDAGHGCPALHVPSNSRAAIPDNRTLGPSLHQIGPSPSHTLVGVHSNSWPDGMTMAAMKKANIIAKHYAGFGLDCHSAMCTDDFIQDARFVLADCKSMATLP